MTTYVCRGQVELQRAADVVRGLTPDKPWRIELVPHRNKRSPEQNAMAWALYTEIAKGTGHSPDEIHEACKRMFLPPRVVTMGDERVTVAGTTTKLDTAEMSDYIERIQAWASTELGVVL